MKEYQRHRVLIPILILIIILQGIFIAVLLKPKKIPKPIAIRGKIAIVIDDWGYNLNNLHILKQIKYPLTCAILPNLSYSKLVAEEAHKKGFQIILHLPMEPHEKFRLEQNTITTSMDESSIAAILSDDLEGISFVAGVSNHMGSKATEDARVMEIIFKELKKRHLFYLDSFVTAKSVCKEVAGKINLGLARRDIFLDNKQDAEYIKGQVAKLKKVAAVYGEAVGIGHDQRITLEVLKEEMSKLAKEGYRLVFISELVK